MKYSAGVLHRVQEEIATGCHALRALAASLEDSLEEAGDGDGGGGGGGGGEEEEEEARRRRRRQEAAGGKRLLALPMHATLPAEQQAAVFAAAAAGVRKVILATNVAETSLTIGGVRVVIDLGLVKEKRYRARARG
jgi:HrpA-like RNA helicase